MSILFIGKRFYTNRDAYSEKFGRIYQLPYYWSQNIKTDLWLIDYHSKEKIKDNDQNLRIISTPIFRIYFFFMLLKFILITRPKTIVASGDCYIGLFSFILAKLCCARFVFDVYDRYDTFSGYKNLGFKNLFHFLLKKADICLFASKKLQKDSDFFCKKTYLVLNGINSNHFYPRNRNDSLKKFSLENNIYIGYFGSMEPERGIDDLIKAIKMLHKENKKIYLLLGGKKREDLNLEYSFIYYLGNIPFNEVPIAMACCNILALPYRNSDFLDNASSCKIGEYIAMEVPILATNANSLISNIHLKTIDKKSLAEHNNPNDLKDKIMRILQKNHQKNKLNFNTWENEANASISFLKNL